jgi:Putative adhesin
MKKLLFALFVLAAIISTTLLAFSQEGKKPFLVKEFKLNGRGNLITQTSGGSITVNGGSGNEVKVTMYVTPAQGSKKNEAPSPEALAQYTFDIRQEGNTIYAVATRKDKTWNKGTALNVSFDIEVPQQVSTQLQTSGGSISVAHVTGTQQARTSGGSLNFKDIKGDTQARTSGGGINLSQYSGKLEASTSGGSINLDEASGSLQLSTSGGSIHLNRVSGDIAAHTSGGSIQAQVQQLGKYLTLETSGGSVRATIPGGQGLDLDLAGNRVKAPVHNFNGLAKDNQVKGRINGGGIPVKMRTSGGTTELTYRL